MQHLAFGNARGGSSHDLHDSEIANIDHHLEGAGVEKVAHQDAGLVAPDAVGSIAVTAQLGAINDVVVEQRRGVDELDDGRCVEMPVARVAAGPRRQQDEQRAQPLAATTDDVVADLVDEHDV